MVHACMHECTWRQHAMTVTGGHADVRPHASSEHAPE